jgi:O-antigen/teichoic acid export membrane protein
MPRPGNHTPSEPNDPSLAGVGQLPNVFRRIIYYGLSRGTADALMALRGLTVASLLGPAAFGGWTLFRLALRYSKFATLGVNRGLEFEVARLRARGTTDAFRQQELVGGTALGFTLLVSSGISLVSLVGSCLVTDPTIALGMRGFAGGIIAEKTWMYGLTYLRSQAALRDYATYEAGHAVLQLAFTAAFSILWGLGGAFGGFFLASLGGFALLSRKVPLRPTIVGACLRRMLSVGLPVVLTMLLNAVLATADRLVVFSFGGTRLLGYYAFAGSLTALAASLGLVIRTVVFPQLYSSTEIDGAPSAVRAHLEGIMVPFARLLPPILGVVGLMLGPAVAHLMPSYLDSVQAARLLIFTGVAAGFATLGTVGVVAAGLQKKLPAYSILALAVSLLLSVSALQFGLGLEGVAAAVLLGRIAFDVSILILLTSVGNTGRRRHFLVRAFLPLVWCAGCVVALGRFLPNPDLESATISLVLFLILVLPLAPGLATDLGRMRVAASRRVPEGS